MNYNNINSIDKDSMLKTSLLIRIIDSVVHWILIVKKKRSFSLLFFNLENSIFSSTKDSFMHKTYIPNQPSWQNKCATCFFPRVYLYVYTYKTYLEWKLNLLNAAYYSIASGCLVALMHTLSASSIYLGIYIYIYPITNCLLYLF